MKFKEFIGFCLVAIILFLTGTLMIYASGENGLFVEPPSAISIENANSIQMIYPNLKGVIHSFVNESLAQRTRLQAIRKLWRSLGEFLVILSLIQICLILLAIIRKRPNVSKKYHEVTDDHSKSSDI